MFLYGPELLQLNCRSRAKIPFSGAMNILQKICGDDCLILILSWPQSYLRFKLPSQFFLLVSSKSRTMDHHPDPAVDLSSLQAHCSENWLIYH